MRRLVLSDIHANYPAVKTIFDSEEFDESIFLGDAVYFGPDPDEVVTRLRTTQTKSVTGNHDTGVLNAKPHDEISTDYRDSRRKPTTSVVRMNPTKPTQSLLDSTA